jgi:hypothetical protein
MKMPKHIRQRIVCNALLSVLIYALPVLLMFAVFYFTGQRPWRTIKNMHNLIHFLNYLDGYQARLVRDLPGNRRGLIRPLRAALDQKRKIPRYCMFSATEGGSAAGYSLFQPEVTTRAAARVEGRL